jgi:predicted TIM-barrel fold metal-dependent hydrolase
VRIVAIEEHFSAPSINEADAGSIARLRGVLGELANRLDDVGELRLRDMDAAGIDVQVLSQVAPGLQVILGHTGELLPYCRTRIDRWLTPDSPHLQDQ